LLDGCSFARIVHTRMWRGFGGTPYATMAGLA
jgi:hypothetical protein